jgi:hypothetical protein
MCLCSQADAAFQNQTAVSTRTLQTTQELLLFHRLLEANNNDEETLKLLKSEVLGPASEVAKGEWLFWRKHLQLMELREEWSNLFETCIKLLEGSRTNNAAGALVDARGADWIVWKGLLQALSKLNTTDSTRSVSKPISFRLTHESYVKRFTKIRS